MAEGDRALLERILAHQVEFSSRLATLTEQLSQGRRDSNRAFDDIRENKNYLIKVDERVHALERAETLNERIRTGVWFGIAAISISALGIVSMAWDSYQFRKDEIPQKQESKSHKENSQ